MNVLKFHFTQIWARYRIHENKPERFRKHSSKKIETRKSTTFKSEATTKNVKIPINESSAQSNLRFVKTLLSKTQLPLPYTPLYKPKYKTNVEFHYLVIINFNKHVKSPVVEFGRKSRYQDTTYNRENPGDFNYLFPSAYFESHFGENFIRRQFPSTPSIYLVRRHATTTRDCQSSFSICRWGKQGKRNVWNIKVTSSSV